MKIVLFNNNHKLDLQHEILYFDKDSIGIDTVDKIKEFNPDLIIEEEKNDGMSRFTGIYKMFPKVPKAWWMIDAHTNLIDHIVYAKQFDYVFCAQSWFIPIVQREVLKKVFYLPLCHTQTITEYQEMLQTSVKKDIDFSFVGNIRSIHVDRKKYVEMLQEMYPTSFVVKTTDYQDMLSLLRRSKATFNCSLNNDLNFRVWEGLACGAVVVTDDVTDVQNIYGLEDYLTLYDKLLPDWQKLIAPADTGVEVFIKSKHTLTHRMLQMIGMVEEGKQYEY